MFNLGGMFRTAGTGGLAGTTGATAGIFGQQQQAAGGGLFGQTNPAAAGGLFQTPQQSKGLGVCLFAVCVTCLVFFAENTSICCFGVTQSPAK